MGLTFPGQRRFAFTIMDDTDVATLANVEPVYRLLGELGFRTTKTVWPVGCPEGSPNFRDSDTLEDPAYLQFVVELQRRGFEIAYHGATMESSMRERTARALEEFAAHFGGPPRVYANHAYNQENLYWGVERLDDPVLRRLYAPFEGRPHGYYQGHLPGSPWWWGDLAGAITYIRNLSFSEVNLLKVNPTLPYRDPRRPLVPWWFSATDAEDVHAFNARLTAEATDRLEAEGGVCIVATHLGKGFSGDGKVHPATEAILRRLAARPGWFVPVGELLDWMQSQQSGSGQLPAREWRRMQWHWAAELVRRKWRPRHRK